MLSLIDIFLILHIVLLVGFVSVTALLLSLTIVNRIRVKHVLLSWYDRPSLYALVWPAAFLLLVISFFCYSYIAGKDIHPLIFTGYFTGSVFWIVSVRLSSAIFVTTCGLICNLNRMNRGIAWGQVVDYFESKQNGLLKYVFFYLDEKNNRCRCELGVPASLQDHFRQVMDDKLDVRFECTLHQALGKKAMEG